MKYRDRNNFDKLTDEWGKLEDCSTPSYCFAKLDEDEGSAEKCLIRIFGLKNNLYNAFLQASSGNGSEASNLLKLHSSALLGLLFFYDVENNPIIINGRTYSQAFFEVKNVVDRNDPKKYPSNIDVALVETDGDDPDKAKSILFLESKFTEPTTGGKTTLKPLYTEWLRKWFDDKEKAKELKDLGITESEINRKSANGKRTLYCDGIKQMIAHLIGIQNGPYTIQSRNCDLERINEKYAKIFHEAREYQLGTILLSPDTELFEESESLHVKEYIDFYKKFVKIIGPNHQTRDGKPIKLLEDVVLYMSPSASDNYRVSTNNAMINKLYGL